MPGLPPGFGAGGGSPNLVVRRVLTAAEIRAINTATYRILPAAPAGVSYEVRRIYFERQAGARIAALRFNPQLSVVLGPESTTGRLNANTGEENFNAYLFQDRLTNLITADAYHFVETGIDHNLIAGAAMLVGLVGTVRNQEASRIAAAGGSLAMSVEYITVAAA